MVIVRQTTPVQLAENLCVKLQVNGQTACRLFDEAERFEIHLILNLPNDETRPMRLAPVQNLSEVLNQIDQAAKGYILPFSAKFLPKTDSVSCLI